MEMMANYVLQDERKEENRSSCILPIGAPPGLMRRSEVVSGELISQRYALPIGTKKDFTLEMFTKHNIAHADFRNYNGEVKAWLETMEGSK